MLTVLYRDPGRTRYKNGTKAVFWICKCDCGQFSSVRAQSLTLNRTKSCGCRIASLLRARVARDPGFSARTALYHSYKRSARKRNYEWSLSKDQTYALFAGDCFYCGCPPTRKFKKSHQKNGPCTANGIDRLDNDIGYTVENSVSCCGGCNRAKGNTNLSEFLQRVVNIYRHRCQTALTVGEG